MGIVAGQALDEKKIIEVMYYNLLTEALKELKADNLSSSPSHTTPSRRFFGRGGDVDNVARREINKG